MFSSLIKILFVQVRSCMLLLSLLCCSAVSLFAQKSISYYSNPRGEQSGASIKMQAEIGDRKNPFNWRLGLCAGAGGYLGGNWLYPSINADIVLYHGGLGSKRPTYKTGPFADVEFNIAYTFTAGFSNRMKNTSKLNPMIRNYPLYYFNNFCTPSLQNPLNISASWGGNLIFFPTRCTTKFQQVGFLNIHVDRFQFSYTNDGPPFSLPFGDKFDRLHTGGGIISLHGNRNWAIDLFELGFNKFTGYSRNSYELSNQSGVIYLYYKDALQQAYNKANIYINVASARNNWGVTVSCYNSPKWDIQHIIHQTLFYPLHMVPHKKYFAVGGMFIYGAAKIGLQ
jgi:Bacterial toxin 23